MEYRNQIRAYFIKHRIVPKPKSVQFQSPLISSHLEYEIHYLTHALDSEYMLDWVPMLFPGNVPVPPPIGKRLSPMEKEFRLQLLYQACEPTSDTTSIQPNSKSAFSVVDFMMTILFFYFLWKYVIPWGFSSTMMNLPMNRMYVWIIGIIIIGLCL